MSRVYLAGPINGCTDEEARGWREEAKRLRPDLEFLDPMVRDYRGRETENAEAIVDGDLEDIGECLFMLVNAARPTWGTAMELYYASDLMGRGAIFAFGAPVPSSPWLQHHARLFPTLAAACKAIP